MATFTPSIALRKPDGVDYVSRVLDINNNLDTLDALFHATTGHKHTGAGTNAPRLLVEQNYEVNYEAAEAATLDTLSAASRIINNLNRIRYYITQVSGQALGTVSTNLATHVAATVAHGATGAVVGTTNVQTLTNKTLTGPDGAVGAPIYSFASSTNTGMFYSGGHLVFTVGGTERVRYTSAGEIQIALAASKVIPGATSYSIRNNANSADNLLLSDAGLATFRNGIVGGTYHVIGGATQKDSADITITGSGTRRTVYEDTSQAVDNRIWEVMASTSQFIVRTVNDAITVSANAVAISRTGTTITGFSIDTGHGIQKFMYEYDAGNSGTALTIDWNNGDTQRVRLTGNVVLTLSNPIKGRYYSLRILQDATGGRTVTWPASVKHPNNTAPIQTATASQTDLWTLYYDGTNYYTGIQQAYAVAN